MLKNLLKSLFIFLFFKSAFALSPLEFKGEIDLYVKEYVKHHEEFSKKICSSGVDFKYKKLLKDYRGNGYYLPELKNEDVDRETVIKYLPLIERKIKYIETLVANLKESRKLPDYNKISKRLIQNIKELLLYKKDFHYSESSEEKIKIKNSSVRKLQDLRKDYLAFTKEIPFLLSFEFPVNHLDNRTIYDGHSDKQAKNDRFFLRKILEDGAYDKDQTRSDLFLRTTIDTVYYSLIQDKEWLSENSRYDLDYILTSVEVIIKRGFEKQVERLEEWLLRTKNTYSFYKDLIDIKNKIKTKEMIHERNVAKIDLERFVLKKQVETYKFWMQKKELQKALFSLETILFNEVGRVDGEEKLERIDVSQVVLKRVQDPFYNSLSKAQELFKLLNLNPKKIQNEKWLNTLFKVGEFSFTYYYIPGVSNIFCPDMSKLGKKVREENLKISLMSLKNFREDFKAIRYFSRASMLGRIDMAKVWSDYEALPEEPGVAILNQNKLLKLYEKGDYEFLYDFKNKDGLEFIVLKINNNTYVMRYFNSKPKFFSYRNPHYFTYFKKK